MHVSTSTAGPMRALILDYAPPRILPVELPSGLCLPRSKNRGRYTRLMKNPGVWMNWGAYPGSDRIGVHGTAGRWFRKYCPDLKIECRRNVSSLEVRAVRVGSGGTS